MFEEIMRLRSLVPPLTYLRMMNSSRRSHHLFNFILNDVRTIRYKVVNNTV